MDQPDSGQPVQAAAEQIPFGGHHKMYMYSQFYVNVVNITHLEKASALLTLPSVLLVPTLFGKVPSFTLEGHRPLCKWTARDRGAMNHSAKGQGWTGEII